MTRNNPFSPDIPVWLSITNMEVLTSLANGTAPQVNRNGTITPLTLERDGQEVHFRTSTEAAEFLGISLKTLTKRKAYGQAENGWTIKNMRPLDTNRQKV